MKYPFTAPAILATLVVTSFACTVTNNTATEKDGGAGTNDAGETSVADSGVDGGKDVGECVPYAPANLSGKSTGTFTSDAVVKIPLPETDVGGGLLKVTYTQAGAVVGSIFLPEGTNAAAPRVETTPFGPGVGAEVGVVYYRLAGKKTYELGIQSFSFDPAKASYTVEYSYEPLIDCYEANDSRAAAKRIPVNTTITAYHHTGIGTDDTSSVNATGDDWYSFELAAQKTVKLKGVLPGKDGPDGGNSAQFVVYTEDGTTTVDCVGNGSLTTDPVSATEAVETCEAALPAGKYFVKLAHFVGQPSASALNESFNKSWNTPYTFSVEAK